MNATVCVGELLSKVNVLVKVPGAVGLNDTSTSQVPIGEIGVVHILLVMVKLGSPAIEAFETVSVA